MIEGASTIPHFLDNLGWPGATVACVFFVCLAAAFIALTRMR